MADVLSDHGLAQTIGADQNKVASLGEEVQGQGTFDHIAFDLLGPRPVEVGHRLKLLGSLTAATFVPGCDGRVRRPRSRPQMFQNLAWRPALFGGARQKVVHVAGHGMQADLFQSFRQAIAPGRHRANGRAHRKSPDRGGGHPTPAPRDGG